MKNQKIYLKLSIIFITAVIFIVGVNFAHATTVNERELGNLLNQERSSRNLSQLNFNFQLYQAAKNKARDMFDNNYFEHYSPQGKSPWDFIIASGYDYKLAGENLAMDFSSSEAVHDAWVASKSHKDNIINPGYEDFAIAAKQGVIDDRETIVIVELFGKKDYSFGGQINSFVMSVTNYLLGYQTLFAQHN